MFRRILVIIILICNLFVIKSFGQKNQNQWYVFPQSGYTALLPVRTGDEEEVSFLTDARFSIMLHRGDKNIAVTAGFLGQSASFSLGGGSFLGENREWLLLLQAEITAGNHSDNDPQLGFSFSAFHLFGSPADWFNPGLGIKTGLSGGNIFYGANVIFMFKT